MKNILSSLTSSEKNRILEMHKLATKQNYIKESYHKNPRIIKESEETVDMSAVKTALTNLNTATKNLFTGIEIKGTEPDAMTYLKGEYYLTLVNATNPSSINSPDFDLVSSKTLGSENPDFIKTPNYGLWLAKNDKTKLIKTNSTSEGVYIASTAPGGASGVPKHKEFLLEQVPYAISTKSKYFEQVENNVKSLYPLIDDLTANLDSLMKSLPAEKIMKMTTINGYEITLTNGTQDDTLSTGYNQSRGN